MADRLVVIGGDAGGMTAASNARRTNADLDIVALEKGEWTSYSACGIPYLVAGDVDELDDLVVRTPDRFRNQQRIDVRIRHEVTGIDLAARRVEVRDHGHERDLHLGFDHLLVATGSHPIRPDIPGIDLECVKGVQTLADAAELLAFARESKCRRVVVVGGSYVGLEMAEAFLKWGAEVTLVDQSTQVMRTFDPDMADRIADVLAQHGADVRLGVRVSGFEPGQVHTSAGSLPADLVVLGIGVAPNVGLLDDAGVELGATGAIRVDRRQQTSVEGVWAAGDCAESRHLVSGLPVHVALGTVANRQGRVAGINIGGGYATFPGVVGTAASRICSTEVARSGLHEHEAAAAGFDVASATIESTTRAGYLDSAAPIAVKLLGERGTRRLLGGQIVGGEGSAKRIDVVATAITAGLTVDEVIDLDLAYAPPVSPLWDPVAIAARRLAATL